MQKLIIYGLFLVGRGFQNQERPTSRVSVGIWLPELRYASYSRETLMLIPVEGCTLFKDNIFISNMQHAGCSQGVMDGASLYLVIFHCALIAPYCHINQ